MTRNRAAHMSTGGRGSQVRDDGGNWGARVVVGLRTSERGAEYSMPHLLVSRCLQVTSEGILNVSPVMLLLKELGHIGGLLPRAEFCRGGRTVNGGRPKVGGAWRESVSKEG